MARNNRTSQRPNRRKIETWPVVWRVVIPAAGSYDHDWLVAESADESAARKAHREHRTLGYPVRLERVSCGPLPVNAQATLDKLRNSNAQIPGTTMREDLGMWSETRIRAPADGQACCTREVIRSGGARGRANGPGRLTTANLNRRFTMAANESNVTRITQILAPLGVAERQRLASDVNSIANDLFVAAGSRRTNNRRG